MTPSIAADADVAVIARLIGEPARAAMLDVLMSGTALTAGELARAADVSPATGQPTPGPPHPGRPAGVGRGGSAPLLPARLGRRGSRHRGPGAVAPRRPVTSLRQSRQYEAMRLARTCYDHVAGRVGVGVYRSLLDGGALTLTPEGLELTDTGLTRLTRLGVDVAAARRRRRTFARACLDATERREHLAGALGAQLCAHLKDLGWLTNRNPEERGLRITPLGATRLRSDFHVDCLAVTGARRGRRRAGPVRSPQVTAVGV